MSGPSPVSDWSIQLHPPDGEEFLEAGLLLRLEVPRSSLAAVVEEDP